MEALAGPLGPGGPSKAHKVKRAIRTENTKRQRSEIVDLHIETLLETTLGLSNRDILRVQLSHFKQKMENAIESNVESITFIHGVGEGVLKFELTERLKEYEDIKEVKELSFLTWDNIYY